LESIPDLRDRFNRGLGRYAGGEEVVRSWFTAVESSGGDGFDHSLGGSRDGGGKPKSKGHLRMKRGVEHSAEMKEVNKLRREEVGVVAKHQNDDAPEDE
jgi:hypothetical protein